MQNVHAVTKPETIVLTKNSPLPVLAFALAVIVMTACSDSGPETDTSPLEGLTKVSSVDSGGGPPAPPSAPGDTGYGSDSGYPPQQPTQPTPGYFRGYVLGQSEPGSGGDTLATAPRIANARVTAYPRLSSSDTDLGPAAASVTTSSGGEFRLPELPGREYVVTFVPPDGSIYRGVYAIATAHNQSGSYPWWVVLPKK